MHAVSVYLLCVMKIKIYTIPLNSVDLLPAGCAKLNLCSQSGIVSIVIAIPYIGQVSLKFSTLTCVFSNCLSHCKQTHYRLAWQHDNVLM